MKTSTNNIAVMASGAGTTFDNLATVSNKGLVNFQINVLFTNKSTAGCVDVAVKHDIMTIIVTEDNVWDFIPENTDLLVLAGWLKLLIVPFEWRKRVLNIHPSLLPKYGGKGFYGLHVHDAVIASSDMKSGCTVHLVDSEYDTGEILEQYTVPVMNSDTAKSLQTRVQIAERQLYPRVIDSYLKKVGTNSK
tara:strand:- start:3053 stop:3625 length:573 start_codon:yes stop_codon:yes gene_type:complete